MRYEVYCNRCKASVLVAETEPQRLEQRVKLCGWDGKLADSTVQDNQDPALGKVVTGGFSCGVCK